MHFVVALWVLRTADAVQQTFGLPSARMIVGGSHFLPGCAGRDDAVISRGAGHVLHCCESRELLRFRSLLLLLLLLPPSCVVFGREPGFRLNKAFALNNAYCKGIRLIHVD